MAIELQFSPSVNKLGLSKLTYIGMNVKEGTREDKVDSKTGEVKVKDYKITNLVFNVAGINVKKSLNVNVTVANSYARDNSLGRVLAAMGFVEPELQTVVDEDDFECEAEDYTETLLNSIETFLNESEGKLFVGKVERAKRGFWEIKADTIKPLVKK